MSFDDLLWSVECEMSKKKKKNKKSKEKKKNKRLENHADLFNSYVQLNGY